MIREYLKLARLSIAALTGLAPVIGAVATGQYQLFHLFFLFLIGVFGHAYGIIHNDIIDYDLDKNNKELSDRPLVSGAISKRKAWIFTLMSLGTMFILAFFLAFSIHQYLPIIALSVPTLCVTLYNLVRKKILFADLLLAVAMFFLILYGALVEIPQLNELPFFVWVICVFGAFQILLLNVIGGGLKDVENDSRQRIPTLAVRLGLSIHNKRLFVPMSFKLIAYTIQLLTIYVAYLPFFSTIGLTSPLSYLQLTLITIISICSILLLHKYLNFSQFERGTIRKIINIHGYINFILAPVLLLHITFFSLLLIFIPGLGFILSNLLLHEKFMQPATM